MLTFKSGSIQLSFFEKYRGGIKDIDYDDKGFDVVSKESR
jgi:hypothetical protein